MAKLCRFLGSWAESQAFFTVEGGVEATGGHPRVGPFNFATLLPVRAMLGLHRFQVDETKEIDVDRNREAVDIEVFYCGLSAPAFLLTPSIFGATACRLDSRAVDE